MTTYTHDLRCIKAKEQSWCGNMVDVLLLYSIEECTFYPLTCFG